MGLGIRETLEAELRARAREEAAVVVTVVASEVTDIAVALRMLVGQGESPQGSIHPSVDEAVIRDGLAALQEEKSQMRSYLVRGNRAEPARLQQGNLDIFFEVLARTPRLIIVGAGHIAVPLAQFGALLDFKVLVVDDRSEYASADRFPTAQRVLVGDYRDTLAGLGVDRSAYVVLVTRGHVHDQACLELLLDSDAAYIGMIGSRRRVRTVLSHLQDAGRNPEKLARVFAPVGLDIGARTPAEIALAIMAEIVNLRRHGHAPSLARKERRNV